MGLVDLVDYGWSGNQILVGLVPLWVWLPWCVYCIIHLSNFFWPKETSNENDENEAFQREVEAIDDQNEEVFKIFERKIIFI